MLKLINCWILDHVCSFLKNKTFRWFKSVYSKHVRFLQDFIVWPKCLETETTKTEKSRDRIGQTGNGQTEMSCSGVSHTNASAELLKRERFLYLLCTITKQCGPWNICLLSWAQFGGGHGGRVPHFFLLSFCIWRGFKNKSDVCHVLCEELFMLDGRPHIATLMLKPCLVWYHWFC